MASEGIGVLHLVGDKTLTETSFEQWHAALLDGAELENDIWWLPKERIAFGSMDHAPSGTLDKDVGLGVNPRGKDWVVYINVPTSPGTENPTSGIGRRSDDGALFLLRQGRLQSNKLSPFVNEAAFRARTGLDPVPVLVDGKPATRDWYVVTRIHDDLDDMRRRTGQFVDACSFARTQSPKEAQQASDDAAELKEKLGADEVGGEFTYAVKANEVTVRRRQGEVWTRLKLRLAEAGIQLQKPRHAKGYEVDGEVEAADGAGGVLIEIKTSCSAADIYTGTGQLEIYPQLLTRLADHRRVLLLPGKPRPVLMEAVEKLQIKVHTYTLDKPDDWSTAAFSPDTLKLCGVP
jgi:hypothetical protein